MDSVLNQIRNFADRAHGDQLRKYSTERYIVHPVRVMETCRKYDDRLPILAAALLHDVLEDTTTKTGEMLEFLNSVMSHAEAKKTLSLVVELTDVYVKTAYPKWNRHTRKQKELDRIAQTSADAQTIKYADILDNTAEITRNDPDFAPRYLRECLEILKRATKGNQELSQKAFESVRGELEALR